MRKFAIALLFPFAVHAQEMVYSDENVTVTLTQAPCVAPVAALVRDDVLPIAKAGTALFQGRTIRLCWAILQPGVVTILDEDGDTGPLAMKDFRPAGTVQKQPAKPSKNSI
jgi:hypothetical protein